MFKRWEKELDEPEAGVGVENARRLHEGRDVTEIREERRISRRNRCQMLQRSRSFIS